MNNSDGVGESAPPSSCSLRVLPSRAVQLEGVMTDMPTCLAKLSELLNGDALREVRRVRDRSILRGWGQSGASEPVCERVRERAQLVGEKNCVHFEAACDVSPLHRRGLISHFFPARLGENFLAEF